MIVHTIFTEVFLRSRSVLYQYGYVQNLEVSSFNYLIHASLIGVNRAGERPKV